MQLAHRLRELRKQNKSTLKELSNATDLSISYLSDIERGRTTPSLETIKTIANAFEISVVDLLSGVDFAGKKSESSLPPGLPDLLKDAEFSKEIDEDWLSLLTRIELRGERPQTKREWMELYLSLRRILEDE